nr:uncharacterized mitochondrial protein AtMg00810-like [Tanacetum cinerariifolium]
MGLWYSKDSGFELIAYSDADHAGCNDDYKSTSEGIQCLGEKLVSWSLKKQDCTSMSTTVAEYLGLGANAHGEVGARCRYYSGMCACTGDGVGDGVVLAGKLVKGELFGTKLSTLEALKELILKISRVITLSLLITVDSREEGVEFEVTGFYKAFILSTLGKIFDLGRRVTECIFDPEEEGGFPKIDFF